MNLPYHKAPKLARRRVPACRHRGETVRTAEVVNCPITGDKTTVPVLACAVHGECTERTFKSIDLQGCTTCQNADDPSPPAPSGFVLDYLGRPADHLAGMVRHAHCFLVCGGPSLLDTPVDLLNQRGILTAAVNNAAATFVRPHFWFSVDKPDHFHEAIWRDPAIMKLVRRDRSHDTIRTRAGDRWVETSVRANQCPNTWFYKYAVADGFDAARFLTCPTPIWAGRYHMPSGVERETRSCMLPALRLLYWLGVRTLYLVGADFRMETDQPYAFDELKGREACGWNNTTYGVLGHWFRALKPHFDAAGFTVLNATPGSQLQAFPRIDFREAVSRALEGFPVVETVRGLYG